MGATPLPLQAGARGTGEFSAAMEAALTRQLARAPFVIGTSRITLVVGGYWKQARMTHFSAENPDLCIKGFHWMRRTSPLPTSDARAL